MIPADVASRLRLVLPDQPAPSQPATPGQQISDVLSDLVPGQRILAEIQALLPNGTYRAVVAQRDITLALPFSAKAGDSLELEVVESDGKMALAFVADRSAGDSAAKPPESVATTLSQTGKLIGDLMGGIENEGRRAAPAPLNGNLPLVENFPDQAADLAPILKDALSKSGVFYEAHQARWVAGELPTEALRQEPQGKILAPKTSVAADATLSSKIAPAGNTDTGTTNAAPTSRTEQTTPNSQTSNSIPRELAPIVQQQLDGLATQNYAWQGQIWAGQNLRWEISENPEDARESGDEPAARWQTRLKLSLPELGGIDATLRLHPGGNVGIVLTANSESSEARLRADISTFRNQLESAGLTLTQMLIQHGDTTE